jgi:hypothetical protein
VGGGGGRNQNIFQKIPDSPWGGVGGIEYNLICQLSNESVVSAPHSWRYIYAKGECHDILPGVCGRIEYSLICQLSNVCIVRASRSWRYQRANDSVTRFLRQPRCPKRVPLVNLWELKIFLIFCYVPVDNFKTIRKPRILFSVFGTMTNKKQNLAASAGLPSGKTPRCC